MFFNMAVLTLKFSVGIFVILCLCFSSVQSKKIHSSEESHSNNHHSGRSLQSFSQCLKTCQSRYGVDRQALTSAESGSTSVDHGVISSLSGQNVSRNATGGGNKPSTLLSAILPDSKHQAHGLFSKFVNIEPRPGHSQGSASSKEHEHASHSESDKDNSEHSHPGNDKENGEHSHPGNDKEHGEHSHIGPDSKEKRHNSNEVVEGDDDETVSQDNIDVKSDRDNVDWLCHQLCLRMSFPFG